MKTTVVFVVVFLCVFFSKYKSSGKLARKSVGPKDDVDTEETFREDKGIA